MMGIHDRGLDDQGMTSRLRTRAGHAGQLDYKTSYHGFHGDPRHDGERHLRLLP